MSKKLPVKIASKPTPPRLTYSRAEAAAALGVDKQTIDALISTDKLRASKPGRNVLIRVADIEAMLDANPASAA